MYTLHNNSILYPHQVKILSLFFDSQFSTPFFLTGGTALSAFYLAHRESQDLDLFSLKEFDTLKMQKLIEGIASETSAEINYSFRSQTFNEIYLKNKIQNWTQKIDIVQEQPLHMGDLSLIENIRIDSLLNIATNKILAIFGRLEPKDYIDLFFICEKTDLNFSETFELAKKKDTGLNEFYFANIIADVDNLPLLPPLKTEFSKDKFLKFYKENSEKLLLKAKPNTK